jgi:hypothetical protein
MLLDRGKNNKKTMGLAAAAVVIILVVLVFFFTGPSDKPLENTLTAVKNDGSTENSQQASKNADALANKQRRVVTGKIKMPQQAIDYQALEADGDQKALMQERKKTLGIKKSLDMIVKSDESFKVGESTVSMQNLLEKAFAQEGKVYEQQLSENGKVLPTKIKAYGVYVVQPGDNLWNIHFGILRDYYAAQGISVETRADEPGSLGLSSGIGKILKFSETMVIIYNMVEGKVVQDINLLEPLSKVVVYNMEAVFNLLKDINYDNVNRIQFDGRNIWIPASQS